MQIKKISDYAYDAILKNIVCLNYKPGEKLSETKLAKELGMSRSPIKNALAKLEKEGLVIIKPQHGTFVNEISIERAKNICDIRIQLEIYAVKLAAELITDDQIKYLQALFDKLDSIPDDTEEKRQFVTEVDYKLHSIVYEASHNNLVSEVIEFYKPEIERIHHANIIWSNRIRPTQAEMKKVFLALKERNPKTAETVMKEHLNNIKNAFKAL